LEATSALDAICRAYWYPLYAYVRRCGQSPHDAQDLTQAFFHQLLQHRWLDAADREKGRLRTFLIVAMKKSMAKEWRRATAQRRGGATPQAPLDTAIVESRFAADASMLPPDAAFDRQWAITLLDRTVTRLRHEHEAAGKSDEFPLLKDCLTAGRGNIDYAMIACRLGTSEGSARVAVHRLRKRFREIYREEIAQTLAEGADLETELRHLAAALAANPG
jgi:RNA polymerase sigma-70 factor (ECF subfamily)